MATRKQKIAIGFVAFGLGEEAVAVFNKTQRDNLLEELTEDGMLDWQYYDLKTGEVLAPEPPAIPELVQVGSFSTAVS